MGGVPITVIVQAACGLQNSRQLDASRSHELDVGFGGFMAILKRSLLFSLTPEHLVVAVGVERWVNVN